MSLQAIKKLAAVSVAPRSAIAAAQPYKTVIGPGLTMNFAFDPSVCAYQQLPMTDALVPAVYQQVMFDALAEFCTTPRRQRSHKKNDEIAAEPFPAFWESIGSMNATYASNLSVGSESHPASGSVELVRPPHQETGAEAKHLGMRMALYNARHQQTYSTLLTMERNPLDTPKLLSADEVDVLEAGQKRRMIDVPTELQKFVKDVVAPPQKEETGGDDEEQQQQQQQDVSSSATNEEDEALLGMRSNTGSGMLLGVVRDHSAEHGDGGLDLFPALNSGTTTTASAAKGEGSTGVAFSQFALFPHSVANNIEELLSSVVPPWSLHASIAEFARNVLVLLVPQLADHGGGDVGLVAARGAAAELVSHNATLRGDVQCDALCQFVCAVPRVFPTYHMPPWRHEVGMPTLRGQTCVAFRVEVVQGGRAVLGGTYFFSMGHSGVPTAAEV